MALLVTGASGFIGRTLVARLLDRGEDVRALLLPGEAPSAAGGARVIRGDVRDPESLREAARGARRVYHLAAHVGDWGEEAAFWAVNVEGTRNVLEAAQRADCERVVMVSSIAVYGSQLRSHTCHEDRPRERGAGPYSRTKVASEALALAYHAWGRVPVTVIRPGNVFGPGAGIWVDTFVRVLSSGRAFLVGGGRGDAALAYVDHVAEVVLSAGETPNASGRIYNATDGAGITWRRYAEDLARAAGAAPPRGSLPYPLVYGLAAAMEGGYRTLRRRERPLVTRDAATLMSSRAPVPSARAASELGYRPSIAYQEAMERIAAYLHRR